MKPTRGARAVLALFAFVLSAMPLASAGFVTGAGGQRAAHLSDAGNAVNVTVLIPETLQGALETQYTFVLNGTAATAPRAYMVAITLSPDDQLVGTSWTANGSVPSGTSSTNVTVTIPADSIQGRLRNAPFRAELRDASGAPVDFVDFSVDLIYRDPPPDGGMLQLAAATVFFWGLVFLYAGYLHLSLRKLRRKAQLLERTSGGSTPREGPK